jgi:tetratricopeptide (TPR) repeat protein
VTQACAGLQTLRNVGEAVTPKDSASLLAKHLRYANGWLELGNLDEAALELEEIPPELKLNQCVLVFRCKLYHAAKQWDMLADVAKFLAEAIPTEPGYWLEWAYGARRAQSIEVAETIMRRGLALHPKCALISFNLACYAAQQGRIKEVPDLLYTAIVLDHSLQHAGVIDLDLEPYWASIKPGFVNLDEGS